MESIEKQALAIQEEVVAHRRYLHENAEVGFEVKKTTEYIYQTLKGYGITAKKLKRGGVIAEILAKDRGRDGFILLRADVDALKMQEESDVAFACKSGHMHACGHDLHAAALLGAAKLLKNYPLSQSVRLLFQPAEELLQGGKYALSQGVTEGVKCAFSLHVLSGVEGEVGDIYLPTAGTSAPSADVFEITLTGRSCHGATPHEGIDAAVAATTLLHGLQTLIAREIKVGEGVLSVGRLEAGTSANVLAQTAVLQGTFRTFDEDTRGYIRERIRQLTKGISLAYRVKEKVTFSGGCPCLRQDSELLRLGQKVWTKRLGAEKVVAPSGVRMVGASEDFAYIAREVPSLLVSVVASQKGGGYPLHHPRVLFDERALSTCVSAYLTFAVEIGVNFSKGR